MEPTDVSTALSPDHQTTTEHCAVTVHHAKQDTQLANRHIRLTAHTLLFHHFSREVASKLAWLDGPDNPWRTLVLPIAQRSTCLQLATLGLAAAHMCVVSSRDQSSLIQMHRDLRDASLRNLNQKMQSELNRELAPGRPDSGTSSIVEMILTMIALCYAEMIIPNSTGWRLHLTGVRTGFERYHLSNHHEKAVSQFFVEEIEYLEVFGSISSFAGASGRHRITSQHVTSDDYFKEFTELLHEITATERSRYNTFEEGKEIPDTDMAVWQARLMGSYESVCMRIDSNTSQDVSVQIGLKSVLKAQYYSCLVYSYQSLAPEAERIASIPDLIDRLYNEVIFMTSWPTEAVSHNISFPLFILGTESQLYTEKQIMIERLFTEHIAATGFSCNSAVLQFLRDFWSALASEATRNWIQYARENEQRIRPFIVF
ncbi:hypothetical protein FBEOM_5398 [Fusarium beomiforme]|uniref:Uncharacterized protein n=1 Tax=Fusarium beomiforme TaxID=44412 RepID=A0A9P5AL19_9HYPO|nr:hypothetical protein FBEOM_5398 [Fusarium beomiforme]